MGVTPSTWNPFLQLVLQAKECKFWRNSPPPSWGQNPFSMGRALLSLQPTRATWQVRSYAANILPTEKGILWSKSYDCSQTNANVLETITKIHHGRDVLWFCRALSRSGLSWHGNVGFKISLISPMLKESQWVRLCVSSKSFLAPTLCAPRVFVCYLCPEFFSFCYSHYPPIGLLLHKVCSMK